MSEPRPGDDSPPTVILGDDDGVFLRWAGYYDPDGSFLRRHALLAEQGRLLPAEPAPGDAVDPDREAIRPDPTDVARFWDWLGEPESLLGRVYFHDSRRGTPLTAGQIGKGLADLLARRWFTPEAFSVYALRWLENLCLHAERRGLLAEDSLAALRRDRWMVDGLPPDPRAAEKFGRHTATAHIRARAVETAGKDGRGIILLDQRDEPVFMYMSLRDLQDSWGPDPDREGLLTHCERLLASYDPSREAVVLERREDRDWLYILRPLRGATDVADDDLWLLQHRSEERHEEPHGQDEGTKRSGPAA